MWLSHQAHKQIVSKIYVFTYASIFNALQFVEKVSAVQVVWKK